MTSDQKFWFWCLVVGCLVGLLNKDALYRWLAQRRALKLMRAGVISQNEARKIVLKAEGIEE